MILINNIPAVNPEQHYAGKTLPQDAVPLADVPIDENVDYDGSVLPADAIPYVKPKIDATNDPSVLIIGGISLPLDTAIFLNGRKVLAQSDILDGVNVFEHILRKPYEIDIDVIVRPTGDIPGDIYQPTVNNQQVFPQDKLNNIWFNIWLPNTVLDVTNTYLNGLGITEIIVESIQPATVRGSTNIPVRIRAFENIPGQTIIM